MPAVQSAKERMEHQLRDAIDRLRDNIDRVEFWANALDRLAQPVPEYQPTHHLSEHLLPTQRRNERGPMRDEDEVSRPEERRREH